MFISGLSTIKSYAVHFIEENFSDLVKDSQKILSSNETWDFDKANNTIVTAYYRLNCNRHSHEEYLEHMTRLFSSEDPMIIFTSPDLVENITAARGKPKRTLVIPMSLNETRMATTYNTSFWEMLPTTWVADYRVYWVWNEKVDFLKKATEMNPFQSNFFAWVDMGLIRWEEYANSTILQRVPPELPSDKIMILNVTRITARARNLMMGAGLFGGYKEGILRFHESFYEVLEDAAITNPKSLIQEQHLMYFTCVRYPGLCFTVRPEGRNNGYGLAVRYPMFYMLAFMNRDIYAKMKQDGLVQAEFGDYTLP